LATRAISFRALRGLGYDRIVGSPWHMGQSGPSGFGSHRRQLPSSAQYRSSARKESHDDLEGIHAGRTNVLAGADFFNVEVLTWRGIVTYRCAKPPVRRPRRAVGSRRNTTKIIPSSPGIETMPRISPHSLCRTRSRWKKSCSRARPLRSAARPATGLGGLLPLPVARRGRAGSPVRCRGDQRTSIQAFSHARLPSRLAHALLPVYPSQRGAIVPDDRGRGFRRLETAAIRGSGVTRLSSTSRFEEYSLAQVCK
jgi:hypothetical protein